MSRLKLSKVDCRRGAPMGRPSTWVCADTEAPRRFYLQQVILSDGGYDDGGAYWGYGGPIYRAYSDMALDAADAVGPIEWFLRAKGRNAAKAYILAEFPNALFWN